MPTAIEQAVQCRWLDADDPLDRADWDAALRNVPHDVYHLAEYVRMDAALSGSRAVSFLATDGQRKLFVPLVVRQIPTSGGSGIQHRDATSPYGFPCPCSQFAPGDTQHQREKFLHTALDKFVGELRSQCVVSAFLRFNPLVSDTSGFERHGVVVQHGDSVYCDLSMSKAELWQQTRRRDRSYINRTRRQGFRVIWDHEWSMLDEFMGLYRETMKRVSAAGFYFFPESYFHSIRDNLAENAGLILVMSPHGDVAGGGIFTQCNGIVQYHLGGTSNRFRHHQPAKLLIDEVRCWAKNVGHQYLHLGGGVGSSCDSLFHFKSGFSNLRAPFASGRLIADMEAYQELVGGWERAANREADRLDGFFPAYRKPAPTLRVVRKDGVVDIPKDPLPILKPKSESQVSSQNHRAA